MELILKKIKKGEEKGEGAGEEADRGVSKAELKGGGRAQPLAESRLPGVPRKLR